ncbi:MAG: hypothetical protein PHE15_01540 [Dehalococcoidales bacterium]|nr:hypothetical protein [Dehalococcoidales bacterium]
MGWRDIKRVYFYIILGLGLLVIFLQVVNYIPVIIRGIVSPETANEKFEHGRYGSWSWTPDGRIIYVKSIEQMEHTRGMGSMGYKNRGTVTQIRIMDADGNNDKLIKDTYYPSVRQKILRRYAEYRKKHFGFLPLEESDKINRESAEGVLDKIYPDPPLSHLGWIDWNAMNNKLVFVANDGTGKTGIAVSDPEFKEVKWIIKYDNSNYIHVAPEWDPNTNRFAYSLGDDVIVYDENGNRLNNIPISQCGTKIGWIPNGKGFLTKRGIIDVKGNWIKEFKESVNDPSISPDGQWVVYFDVSIWKMSIDGENKIELYHKGGSFFPKWSPDGKKILMGWEGNIEVINPDGTGYKAITFKE